MSTAPTTSMTGCAGWITTVCEPSAARDRRGWCRSCPAAAPSGQPPGSPARLSLLRCCCAESDQPSNRSPFGRQPRRCRHDGSPHSRHGWPVAMRRSCSTLPTAAPATRWSGASSPRRSGDATRSIPASCPSRRCERSHAGRVRRPRSTRSAGWQETLGEGGAAHFDRMAGALHVAARAGWRAVIFGTPCQMLLLCQAVERSGAAVESAPGNVVFFGGGWKTFGGEAVDGAALISRVDRARSAATACARAGRPTRPRSARVVGWRVAESRRLALRTAAAVRGVSSVLPLGRAEHTAPGAPHDGMLPLSQLVDWARS